MAGLKTPVFVDVTVYERVIAEIARGPDTYDFVKRVVDDLAEDMRRGAPRKTGRGAASIRGQVHMGPDGWYGTASWTEPHYYLGILNATGRKFVEPALSRVRYV